jgi:uncharacterized protein YciI
MRNPVRFLLAILLMAAPALRAQAPAATPAPAANAPAMKSFFIRLIPPRSTFLQDMTDAERKLMADHAVYWKDLFDKGVCVFGGPVLDPKGVYGVMAVRAASEDEARALIANDPSVKAGLNHFDVAEMRIAFLPKAKSE